MPRGRGRLPRAFWQGAQDLKEEDWGRNRVQRGFESSRLAKKTRGQICPSRPHPAQACPCLQQLVNRLVTSQLTQAVPVKPAPKGGIGPFLLKLLPEGCPGATPRLQEQKPGAGDGLAVKIAYCRAGEMAQWLRALTALPEVVSSIPSNHIVAHSHL